MYSSRIKCYGGSSGGENLKLDYLCANFAWGAPVATHQQQLNSEVLSFHFSKKLQVLSNLEAWQNGQNLT